LLAQDFIVQTRIAEAREAYKAGDYQTLGEYVAKREERKK
jgi:hypothetical protein